MTCTAMNVYLATSEIIRYYSGRSSRKPKTDVLKNIRGSSFSWHISSREESMLKSCA